MSNNIRAGARTGAAGLVLLAIVSAMTGCSIGSLQVGLFEQQTSAGLKVTAEQVAHSDGYCGVGVKVENASDRAARFADDDVEVFMGSSMLDWGLAFADVPARETVQGYVVGEFPSMIEAGSSASHAFVVNCEDEPFTITVWSANAGSVTLDF